MTEIRAIETRYAGCHFRSRLEARWAVFWDHLGLEWEYEPQGFHTPAGGYLPDFFLPDADLYVEIKGKFPSDGELAKCQHIPNLIILVGSIPRTPEGIKWYQIGECTKGGLLCLAGLHKCTPGWTEWTWDDRWPFGPNREGKSQDQAALTAARSARFEHGQSGPGPRP